jgi:hypothetical protein
LCRLNPLQDWTGFIPAYPSGPSFGRRSKGRGRIKKKKGGKERGGKDEEEEEEEEQKKREDVEKEGFDGSALLPSPSSPTPSAPPYTSSSSSQFLSPTPPPSPRISSSTSLPFSNNELAREKNLILWDCATYGTVFHREKKTVEKWMHNLSDTYLKPLPVQFLLAMSTVTDLWVGENVDTQKKEIEMENKERKRDEKKLEKKKKKGKGKEKEENKEKNLHPKEEEMRRVQKRQLDGRKRGMWERERERKR